MYSGVSTFLFPFFILSYIFAVPTHLVIAMQNFQDRFKRKSTGRQTGGSPETHLSIAWNVLAVTFLFLFI